MDTVEKMEAVERAVETALQHLSELGSGVQEVPAPMVNAREHLEGAKESVLSALDLALTYGYDAGGAASENGEFAAARRLVRSVLEKIEEQRRIIATHAASDDKRLTLLEARVSVLEGAKGEGA